MIHQKAAASSNFVLYRISIVIRLSLHRMHAGNRPMTSLNAVGLLCASAHTWDRLLSLAFSTVLRSIFKN